jgi:hypothetical protein
LTDVPENESLEGNVGGEVGEEEFGLAAHVDYFVEGFVYVGNLVDYVHDWLFVEDLFEGCEIFYFYAFFFVCYYL